MKKTFQILIFSFFPYLIQAQSYLSNLEQEYFDAYEIDSTQTDLFKGLCLIDSTFTEMRINSFKIELDQYISTLPPQEEDKKEMKRVKKIYEMVHDKYLSKYVAKSYFNEIFTTGNYNCVSATALYAYIFDRLNIPYHIKELPTHVYLIAYPETYKIQIETTVPGSSGFYVPQKSEIEKIVNQLVENKLISKAELQKDGYDKVFNDFFYNDPSIGRNKLIGIQYYNKALFDYVEDQNAISSLGNLLKSMLFYKSPLAQNLLKELLYLAVSEDKISQKENIVLVLKNLKKINLDKNFNRDYIEFILYKLYSNDEINFTIIESFIADFETIEDAKLKEITLRYTYEYLAEQYSNKYEFKKALYYGEKLLEMEPKSKLAQEVVIFNSVQIASKSVYNQEAYFNFDAICQKYPFTMEDNRVVAVYINFYAVLMETNIHSKNEKDLMAYFGKFELLVQAKKELILSIYSNMVAEIYLAVGRYYYGQSITQKALDIFNKGLVLFPDHKELIKMAEWAKEDLD